MYVVWIIILNVNNIYIKMQLSLIENRIKTNINNMTFFFKDERSEPTSSTSIKELYKKGDYDTIKKITFKTVAKNIIKFYDRYYENDKNG